MRRLIFLIASLVCLAGLAEAQSLTVRARVEPASTQISDHWFGRTRLVLGLSQGVPYRVFTLSGPPRLVIDFRDADFSGLTAQDLLPEPGRISALRFGAFRPGWSRLVADLTEPMLPTEIDMKVDEGSGKATIRILMRHAKSEAFLAASGPPTGAGWDSGDLTALPQAPITDDDIFTVVIDPGHGGIDPGAVRDGITEKDLMLAIARALADSLKRSGDVNVVLTRNDDRFVSLPGRVAAAHHANADLFISLHADALSEGGARGATIYTLSEEASDAAGAQLALQQDRADILAGVDLSDTDDELAGVLMDLARVETAPRARMAADAIIAAMTEAGGPMNTRPERRGNFSVLKSADIPSILIEVGFLSSPRDLDNLRDPVWRAVMIEAIATGILEWRKADLAQSPLMRR